MVSKVGPLGRFQTHLLNASGPTHLRKLIRASYPQCSSGLQHSGCRDAYIVVVDESFADQSFQNLVLEYRPPFHLT